MVNKITVYTRTTCPYCELVKKFLASKGAEYQTINMEEDLGAMQAVMDLTGRSIAPTILIEKPDGQQEVVVGFNLSKLAPALV